MANEALTRLSDRRTRPSSDDNFATSAVQPLDLTEGLPEAEWVRGTCPECGALLVSNMYYIGGKGYLVVWECWKSLSENPKCSYRRVL